MREVVEKYYVLQIGIRTAAEGSVSMLVWVLDKSAQALGRWSRMKGWVGVSGKIATVSIFLLLEIWAFGEMWEGVSAMKGWDAVVGKIVTVFLGLLVAFWSGWTILIWVIGPPRTDLKAVEK